MKSCLILFLTVAVAKGQSVLTISPGETTGQKTNATLPVMSNSSLWAGTNHLMYSPPKQHNIAGWKLPYSENENTNNAAFALGTTNAFQSMIMISKTNNATNVTARAIYNRVGSEADKLVITDKVASVQNNFLDKSTSK